MACVGVGVSVNGPRGTPYYLFLQQQPTGRWHLKITRIGDSKMVFLWGLPAKLGARLWPVLMNEAFSASTPWAHLRPNFLGWPR